MNHFYIVYGDLSFYDSESELDYYSWNVQVIVQQHPDVGWHTQCKYDFYIQRDGRWVGVDRAGLMDHVQNELGLARFNTGIYHEVRFDGEWVQVDEYGFYKWLSHSGICLFGRTMTTHDFDEAMRVALKIRRVEAEKSGWLAGERPD